MHLFKNHARNEKVGTFRSWGGNFSIFELSYNAQFWSYKHVTNMFLVHFGLKKHLRIFSERYGNFRGILEDELVEFDHISKSYSG